MTGQRLFQLAMLGALTWALILWTVARWIAMF